MEEEMGPNSAYSSPAVILVIWRICFLLASVCMAVARNSLGTKYYPWFYKAIQSKAYPTANVQQEVHIVLRSVFVLLLVSKNTSGFKQAWVMFWAYCSRGWKLEFGAPDTAHLALSGIQAPHWVSFQFMPQAVSCLASPLVNRRCMTEITSWKSTLPQTKH